MVGLESRRHVRGRHVRGQHSLRREGGLGAGGGAGSGGWAVVRGLESSLCVSIY
jgi:hypothetical protein